MVKLDRNIISEWHGTVDDTEMFLEFAGGLHINRCFERDGVRTVWFENGMNYTVDTEMCDTDGRAEREIIDMLQACGVEFDNEEE